MALTKTTLIAFRVPVVLPFGKRQQLKCIFKSLGSSNELRHSQTYFKTSRLIKAALKVRLPFAQICYFEIQESPHKILRFQNYGFCFRIPGFMGCCCSEFRELWVLVPPEFMGSGSEFMGSGSGIMGFCFRISS